MYSSEKPKMSTFLVHTDFVTAFGSLYRGAKSSKKEHRHSHRRQSETIPIPVHASLLVVVNSNHHWPHYSECSFAECLLQMIHAAVCASACFNLLNTLGNHAAYTYGALVLFSIFPIDIRYKLNKIPLLSSLSLGLCVARSHCWWSHC